jgi:cytochrome c553
MKLIIALILFCAATTASANPFPGGDAQAGQRLFEKHHCERCHVEITGGDGSAIFTRPQHKIRTAAELLAQIRICSANVSTTFSPQETQDLAAYLNRFYNLK